MDSALPLLIDATVTCLVFFIARISIGPWKPSEASQIDDHYAATTSVVERPPIAEASPAASEHAVAVPAVEQSSPSWQPTPVATIPKCLAFFDIETTGLSDKDRIVTLAGVKLLNTETLSAGSLEIACIHLIFDPGRKSHPRAEVIHGYSDWVLRHQEGFDVYAETIESFFNSADMVVAHNAEFDVGFYNREMARFGRAPITKPIFCTMDGYRQKDHVGSSSLSAICQKIGLARATKLHGALEDAWQAMRVYLWLNNCSFSAQLPAEFAGDPTNLKPVPSLPIGPLPRRQRKKSVAAGGETVAPVSNPSLPPSVLQ